jgi:microcystin-dependent protein
LTKRVGIIGSNSGAVTLPGWNDFEFQQFERSFLVAGVIQGIGSAFAVSQRGAGANMSVDVAAGRGLIQITNTNLAHGKTYKVYWDSDAVINVGITAADLSNPRKDRVVIRVDVSQNPDGSSANVAILEVLAGTPAGSPVAPATPANAISLAVISVATAAASIVNANITDDRTYVTLSAAALADIARKAELTTLSSDLASVLINKGASLIGVEDAAGHFVGDNVEEVLDELQDNINTISPTPPGALVMWGAKTAPAGWLLCNGQIVSRSTYAGLFAAIAPVIGTFTVTIASPAVFSKTTHGLVENDTVYFTTTGALPTGLTANTVYYVIATGLTANQFQVAATLGGAAINTSGSQSGTHTLVSCPFGLGDGSTTFNLPDLRGRVPLGDDLMGSTAASRVTAAKSLGVSGGTNNGAHTHTMTTGSVSSGGGATAVTASPTANTNLLPPYLAMFYIIRT